MDSGRADIYTVLCLKLAQYQIAHNERSPARIFASEEALRELAALDPRRPCLMLHRDEMITFHGIPVSPFYNAGGPEIFLSEEHL